MRTKIGWHLIEVLGKKAGEARTFEEAQEEVVAALEARKRSDGLQLYRMQLREFEKLKVEIYEDFMN